MFQIVIMGYIAIQEMYDGMYLPLHAKKIMLICVIKTFYLFMLTCNIIILILHGHIVKLRFKINKSDIGMIFACHHNHPCFISYKTHTKCVL